MGWKLPERKLETSRNNLLSQADNSSTNFNLILI